MDRATYTERVKALRKVVEVVCACGAKFGEGLKFYGYGDDAECEGCVFGEVREELCGAFGGAA